MLGPDRGEFLPKSPDDPTVVGAVLFVMFAVVVVALCAVGLFYAVRVIF